MRNEREPHDFAVTSLGPCLCIPRRSINARADPALRHARVTFRLWP